MKLEPQQIDRFRETVNEYYAQNYRPMPWRADTRFYYVLVSEIMLQQTQVSRVLEKFKQFIAVFPSVASLAEADQADVLELWSGLGYNRRARFLHQASMQIANLPGEASLNDQLLLESLPGVGPNTAAAIRAYVFDEPVVYIETNIRSVYIHHFYTESDTVVTDAQILSLVEQTLDKSSPREWYWALMDYGSYIKKSRLNPSRKSETYKKQSKFEGSIRQLRGVVLRSLQSADCTFAELQETVNDERLSSVIDALIGEKLTYFNKSDQTYSLRNKSIL